MKRLDVHNFSFGRAEEHEVVGEERLRHLPAGRAVLEGDGGQPVATGVTKPLHVPRHSGENQRYSKR